MPTYGYRCEKNGHEFEVFQGMTDPSLKQCTICGAPVRRIFYPVGIVFKGPGFYKTDSRSGSASGIPAGEDRSASGTGDEKGAEVSKADPKKDKSAAITSRRTSRWRKPSSKSSQQARVDAGQGSRPSQGLRGLPCAGWQGEWDAGWLSWNVDG